MWKDDESFTVINIFCVAAWWEALISSVISFIWYFRKLYSPNLSEVKGYIFMNNIYVL